MKIVHMIFARHLEGELVNTKRADIVCDTCRKDSLIRKTPRKRTGISSPSFIETKGAWKLEKFFLRSEEHQQKLFHLLSEVDVRGQFEGENEVDDHTGY